MSQDLQMAIDWNSLCEKKSFTIVTEYGYSDVSFITNMFLVKHVVNKHAVCLILFNKSLEHFHQIASKFGINLSHLEDQEQLFVLELLKDTYINVKDKPNSDCYTGDIPVLCDVIHRIKAFLEKIKTNYNHFIILIDDLSVLVQLNVPLKSVINFVESCRYLSRNNNGCLVITLHDDVQEEDMEQKMLRVQLQHSCDSSFEVTELATGHSKDISGQITDPDYRSLKLVAGGNRVSLAFADQDQGTTTVGKSIWRNQQDKIYSKDLQVHNKDLQAACFEPFFIKPNFTKNRITKSMFTGGNAVLQIKLDLFGIE